LRTNFKLNRAAALAEWRQLLGAWVLIAPINLMLVIINPTAPFFDFFLKFFMIFLCYRVVTYIFYYNETDK